MTTFDWNGNSSITVVPARCFENCSSLTAMNMPETVKEICSYGFSNCASLTEINIPSSVKTIANHAFAWCTSLEIIRMGNSFEYFNNTGDNSFTYSAGKVKEIYIPKSFYATAPDASLKYKVSYVFHGVTSDCKFFYCGTVEEFATAKANFLTQVSATSNNNKFTNAKVITYADYLANTEAYATGNYVICEYNACDAFYEGIHEEDNNPCVINCNRCEAKGVAEKDPVHNIVTSLTYVSFIEKGIKVVGCTNESCAYGSTEEKDALFTYSGESTPEFAERDAIAIGFNVNIAAIIEYEAITGSSVSYGVFAVSKDRIGNNPIFDANGKAADGVISACVESRNSVSFTLKIIGFSNTQYHDSRFAMGAYVAVNNGESTEYSYLQGGEPAEGESYYFISYNDIVNAQ
jgi:hypothetical protein